MGPEIKLIQLSPEQEESIKNLQKVLENFSQHLEHPKPAEEYLTKNEAAAFLKVDPSTIYNWTRKKILKSYGLSGRIYYKRSEIEASITPLK